MALLRHMREAGKRMVRRAGFVIHRWPGTRFDAMEDALQLLRRAGFQPDVVLDIGANHGQWAGKARRVFPEAMFHLVEPQTGCAASLQRMAAASPNVRFYPVVMTRPNVSTVLMAGGGEHNDLGGNFIVGTSDSPEHAITYPATSVDAQCASIPARRILLKLDVEGHELAVLEGAQAV